MPQPRRSAQSGTCTPIPLKAPRQMDFFLQLLFTGIGIGAVYALVALGFVLIFRATSVVNFAQGEFSMVAAYLMVVFAVDLGWPYWLAFLIAIAGMALLGAIFNLTVYYPLRNRTFLPVLISTIGASIFLSNSVLALYGPQPQVLPGWLDTPGFQLGPVYLDSQYLIIIAVTLALVAFQYWLFERTLIGKKLQATSQDKEMATLLGIPVAGMIMVTFVYSAVLGGIAGIPWRRCYSSRSRWARRLRSRLSPQRSSAALAMSQERSSAASRSESSRPSGPPISPCRSRTPSPSWR